MSPLLSPRPKAGLRAVSEAGHEFGLLVTEADVARVGQVVRWRCLSADHLARYEMGKEHWHPAYLDTAGEVPTRQYASRVEGIKRRFAKFARITPDAETQVGPVVKSMLLTHRFTGWYATRYGLTVARVPWTSRHTGAPNPLMVPHMWLAADIGQQVEALGVRVLSEREVARAENFRGVLIEADLASTGAPGATAAAQRPDLVALAPNGVDYIAIEVERRQGRPLATYVKKFEAYERNPTIYKVWYACASEATASRVERAAVEADVDPDWLRIRVVSDVNGLWGVDDLDQRTLGDGEPKLMRDLSELQALP